MHCVIPSIDCYPRVSFPTCISRKSCGKTNTDVVIVTGPNY